ncbi:hypothetical protein [Faecalibaculum rodentium]|uniref:hypothetical protein n=1 Tax=Faecalibaculum rodentium TaxID=1702221 RepID=UPI00272A38D4|nr:hypothetical protein [Faecalibaculum rodentium]
MTEDKKRSVIESIKDMAQALVQAKQELKDGVELADEAAAYAQSASDRVLHLVESVGEAERKLRQLMDLLDDEVRP